MSTTTSSVSTDDPMLTIEEAALPHSHRRVPAVQLPFCRLPASSHRVPDAGSKCTEDGIQKRFGEFARLVVVGDRGWGVGRRTRIAPTPSGFVRDSE